MLKLPSILDTDFYKLTMQQAVLEHYSDVEVCYKFTNRKIKETSFTNQFAEKFSESIQEMKQLKMTLEEKNWLKENYTFLKPQYLEYLYNYRFDPSEIDFNVENEAFNLTIKGPWHRTILWEVPLMATISELYFEEQKDYWSYDGQQEKITQKGLRLNEAGCKFADFGTRRRRSFFTQDLVVQNLQQYSNFVGTSNVHLAHKYGLKAIGTQAHEWIMGISALESLKHANRFSMQKWSETYGANLGTVLPDTFGLKPFFEDFNLYYANLFDSIRHDSGSPFEFVDKVVEHYQKLKIDPMSKTIVFSDGLNVDSAIELNIYCKNKIKCAFGIGTNFTNDFITKALNMVIKLFAVREKYGLEIPVVKISEDPPKATGEANALAVAFWTFYGIPLKSSLE